MDVIICQLLLLGFTTMYTADFPSASMSERVHDASLRYMVLLLRTFV